MSQAQKIKFATQLDPETLKSIQNIADTEGKEIQLIFEEAVRTFITNWEHTPRKKVLEALHASMKDYGSVYESLSK